MYKKSKLFVICALVILSFFSIIFAGCLLGDDIETIRSKVEITVPGGTLAAKLLWLESNARSGGNYLIEVTADEIISPTKLSYGENENITITLRGVGENRTISLSSAGSMFTVDFGVTLVLDNNITLQGRSDSRSLVYLGRSEADGEYPLNSGTLIMNDGSAITGGGSDYFGVDIAYKRTFIMNGGIISGNAVGGVYVGGGTFTMNGGTISGNTGYRGGGVIVGFPGTFTMTDGKISGNTSYRGGGGVNVDGGTFTMTGGEISGNTARESGGGVYVVQHGTFTKTGGTIYGYSANDPVNSNVVKNSDGVAQGGRGHAVYASKDSVEKRKETIAGPGVHLSFDGTTNPPTFDGGWETDPLPSTLAGKIEWLQNNAQSGGEYVFEVLADESIAPHNFYYYNRRDITITLIGIDANRTISLSSNGSMFTIDSGVTLVLDDNITLRGRDSNTASLVYIDSGGTLIMNDGSAITGNTAFSNGGGVRVDSGTFTMNGGKISGNTAYGYGGGVYLDNATHILFNHGTFSINGGEISGNIASSYGGGVYVGGGDFTKTGGTIYGYDAGDTVNNNVVKDSSGAMQSNRGHAVYASNSVTKRKETTAGPEVNLFFGWNNYYDKLEFDGEWETDLLPNTLAGKIAWLQNNAQSGGEYVFEVTADESIGTNSLSYGNRSNITLTIVGIGANRTISLSSNGWMFAIGSGVTLVLDNNITLRGRDSDTDSLVYVDRGGTLIMNDGSAITGNTASTNGGGVRVDSGTFTMNGGEISGNTAINYGRGGGVYLISEYYGTSATFTMNGGVISGNAADGYGGGVYVDSGTFIMKGGEISSNRAGGGGGVAVDGAGDFSGTFTMSGGVISGNTAGSGGGGGVYVGVGNYSTGIFTMSGGIISGNTANGIRVGVDLYYNGSGGGVKVGGRGTFTKTGGTIFGYNASDTVNSNVVKDRDGVVHNQGHAVYANRGIIIRRKETTAGPGVNLSLDGSNGAFSSGWDNDPLLGGLVMQLEQLQTTAQDGGSYSIEVSANESIEPFILNYSSNITITLKGIGANRTISLSSNGSMFSIGSGVTLVLDSNITLQGHSDNTDSLLKISGGTLIMNDGSAISGNTATYSPYSSSSDGSGVYVRYGTFTMNGGEISGNKSSSSSTQYGGRGGGVNVEGGDFTMTGGKIYGNAASYGSGVYVIGSYNSGTFTMNGGEISGNSGSGVYVIGIGSYNSETFTMNGGEISGNTGRGVYVHADYAGRGTFTMNGGEISGNTSGGVSVGGYTSGSTIYRGIFTMSGGEISGNTGPYGGGVLVNGGTFTMSGGKISGNIAISSPNYANLGGGGVYVRNGIFTKTGGTIYGYSADDNNSNVVKDSNGVVQSNQGHAVYASRDSVTKRRETTAGPGDALAFNGTVDPPTFSGAWED